MLSHLWRSVLMASVFLWLVAPPAGAEEAENGAKREKGRSYAPLVKGGWGDLAPLNKESWGDRAPLNQGGWGDRAPLNQGVWGDRQLTQSLIQVTGVRLNPTDNGVEVILETPQGKALQPRAIVLGKSYIANIPNAVLVPQKQEFRQDNPASGITRVRVTQVTANSIRVIVTGEAALPQVQLYDSPNEGLIFSFTPGTSTAQPTAEDEQREIVVTDERDEGYNPQSATTATRTDTPLRDIPQSITVVPRQVLEDRNVTRLNEALETVSGVTGSFDRNDLTPGARVIRGFVNFNTFRNGLSQGENFDALDPIATIERVEVLRGPASVLFGALEPGGIVNTVTRQPLSDPYYRLEFQAGNRNFYQPIIDFSGPLTDDDTVLYRLIAGYDWF